MPSRSPALPAPTTQSPPFCIHYQSGPLWNSSLTPRFKNERCKAVIQKSIKLSFSPHFLLGFDHELAGTQQIDDLLLPLDHLVLDGGGADLDPVHEEAAGIKFVEATDWLAFGWGLEDEGAEILLVGH